MRRDSDVTWMRAQNRQVRGKRHERDTGLVASGEAGAEKRPRTTRDEIIERHGGRPTDR